MDCACLSNLALEVPLGFQNLLLAVRIRRVWTTRALSKIPMAKLSQIYPLKVRLVMKQKGTLSTQTTIRNSGAWSCRNKMNKTCLVVRKSPHRCTVSREASRLTLPLPNNFNSAATFQESKGTMTHLSFTLITRTFRSRIALSTEIYLLGSTKEIHCLPNSRVW